MAESADRPIIKQLIHTGIIAASYYILAEISRELAATPQAVTPVWPSDGIAAAAVLTLGMKALPGVFLGSFLANIWAFASGVSGGAAVFAWMQVITIALGTTAGTAVGGYLMRRQLAGQDLLAHSRHVFYFVLYMVLGGTVINATSGVTALCVGPQLPWSAFGAVWLTWWLSNVCGIVVVAPVILVWLRSQRHKLAPQMDGRMRVEMALVCACILIVGYESFLRGYAIEYLLIPCLIWAAFRFHARFGLSLMFLVATMAVLGTVRGLGTYARPDLGQSLLLLQGFIGCAAVTTLFLLATLRERSRALDSLEQSRRHSQAQAQQLSLSNEELRAATAAAQAASRAKTEFLANMSHEIRTPMNAVLGFCELLQSNDLDLTSREYVTAIGNSGNALLALINDILDLSKIEAGQLPINYEPVILADLLHEVEQIYTPVTARKQLALSSEIRPGVPAAIQSDPVRLRQVLVNLLGNAIKFTDQGYIKIIIDARARPDNDDSDDVDLDISIQDTGIGIEPNQQQLIFEAFRQADGKIFRKHGGTGLGLAITKRLVEMLGGSVSVTSVPGDGSTFTVALSAVAPVSLEERNIASAVGDSEADADLGQFQPAKVLVVDDVPSNLELMRGIFRGSKHELLCSDNGSDALHRARHEQPNMIFLDLRMPEMDGFEVARRLRGDPKTQDIPILLVTASISKDDLAAIQDLCNGFVQKPFRRTHIVQAMRDFWPLAEGSAPLPVATVVPTASAQSDAAQSDANSPPMRTVANPAMANNDGAPLPDWDQLIAELTREETQWQTLCETQIRRDLLKFTARLRTLADTHQCQPLLQYASNLEQQIRTFDLDNMPQTLQSFPEVRQQLERHSTPICKSL